MASLAAVAASCGQGFRITQVDLSQEGRFETTFDAVSSAYYLLYRGASVERIDRPVDMALGVEPSGRLADSTPVLGQSAAFYRVVQIPVDQPSDTDGDGIDDVYELRRPPVLNPLNAADAAQDPDGDGRTHLQEYLSERLPLTTVSHSSPAPGEGAVAVTRETVIHFTLSLASGVSIGPERLFAEFGGRRLLSRVELSSDRRKVTLFYLEHLPGSARVRVTLDGNGLDDSLNRPVDFDGDGQGGGRAVIDFETVSLSAVPGTAVCGRVFASELAPAGSGNMSVNVPLKGVTITVDGREETMRAVTDQNGDFRLEPAPAGRFFVHIDGRTATNTTPATQFPEGPYYPFVGKAWESIAGEEVNIGEIYLPLVTASTLQPVNTLGPTVVTFPSAVLQQHPELGGLTVTVPPGSLFSDNGTRGGMVGIAPVPPDRLPSPLPLGLNLPLVITVQTDGPANFDTPAPVCFPNLPDPETGQPLPAGSASALWSFNHDTGRFEIAGSMTVSADGKLVCTDPGVGIPAPGWGGTQPGTQGDGGPTTEGGDGDRDEPKETGGPPIVSYEDSCDAAQTCVAPDPQPATVYLQNGEEYFTRTDLFIPGRGEIHFAMRRTYRSQLDYDGPLGQGWTFDYNEGLFVQDNGDVTRFNRRSRIDGWKRKADGTYQQPTGFFAGLARLPDGTFVFREPDGFKRSYRADGRLAKHEDRNGNVMLFDYDERGNLARVIDPFGREVLFIFETFSDGRDRLTRLIDFLGREVLYRYDDRFDLVEVRTPVVVGTSTGNDFPNGRRERYTYSSGFARSELNHNLLSCTYPEDVASGGPPRLSWTYGTDPNDPVTFDKVLAETQGGVNASGIPAGGTMAFKYEMLNQDVPPGNLELPRGKATTTERNGNVLEYFVNERNAHILTRRLTKGLRPGEPPAYETRSFFDEDGQLVRRVFPEGNEVRQAYDRTGPRGAQRNLIEVRRVADAARGGGEDLVTTFTYEPLYNRVTSITEPRGNAAGFTPPLGSASAARYTTRFFYDYQESSAPVRDAQLFGIDVASVSRGLGDLNGDGRTDQTSGNLVRIETPTVQLLPDSEEAGRRGTTEQKIITEAQWNDRGQRLAVIDAEGNVTESFYHPENDPDGDGQPTLSPFLAINTAPTGYQRAIVVDSRTSPRRTTTAPPARLETVLSYDRVGNLIATRNPRGVVTAIEVNPLNEPVVITRGADVSAAIASKQLLQAETPFGYRTRLFYDHNGRLVRRQTENRDSTTAGVGEFVDRGYTYDILDNVLASSVEVDAATTLVTQLRYDPNELPILLTRPEDNKVRTEYDERNLPFRVTRGFESAEASTIQVNYDRNGNQREILDAEDNDGDGQPERTTLVYDGFDRRKEIIDALGNRSVRTFDPAGNVTRRESFGHPPGRPDAAKVRLSDNRFHHDELNRIFQVDAALFVSEGFSPARPVELRDQDSDGLVTQRFEYDALSRMTFTVEDDLQVTQMIYDGASRGIEAVDHLGNRVLTTYDQNSNPIRVQSIERSPDGLVPNETFTTHSVYDQLDRLVRVTDNVGQTTRFAYDSRDNLILRSDGQGSPVADALGLFPGQINQPGNTVAWFYDGLDRRILQLADLRADGQGGNALDTSNPNNPDGQIALGYQFDGNSRLIGIVDDNGNRTRFGYDALDRRTSQTNADNARTVMAYDRDDDLRQATDPNGTVAANVYDALNRLTRSAVTRAPGVGGTTEVTYEYDGLSRMTRSADDNGSPTTLQTCEYVYDSLSRVLEDRQNGQPVSTVWSGDGKRLRCVYPGGRALNLAHDAIDRVKTVADAAGRISECFWIGPGLRELRRNYANDTLLSFLDDAGTADIGYDGVQRIARQRHLLPGGGVLADREYGYNRANMRTFERRHEHAELTDRYTYDSTYRIVRTELDQPTVAGAVAASRESAALVSIRWRRSAETTLRQGSWPLCASARRRS
ncbi:MAG: RHS repeat protein, partial [Verrucomicrobia bacterium]|nr:RHS repeat protein [Verrucomicrobiota bacterium]